MNNNVEKRLKEIKTENYIWIIYLIIIGLSYYANYYEKDYFLNLNTNSKETYRKTNTLIFTMLTLIYAYFEKDAINSYLDKSNKTNKQKKYDTLILLATSAVLISGIIFLYIIVEDKDIETEIAFN